MAVLPDPKEPAAAVIPRRLCHLNLGFLRDRHLKRILGLLGHDLRLGLPGPEDGVLVWGNSPTAWRGERLAEKRGRPLVRIEDAFLRSIRPGRMGDRPLGLLIDPVGVHFDASRPSALEQILANDPLDNSHLLSRARVGMERMQSLDLSKYNMHDASLPLPAPGYVLVVDQVRGDASVRASGADQSLFEEMLADARASHPGQRIVIKTHPESSAGIRPGHYGPEHLQEGVTLISDPVSPRALLEGAVAVYTLSSQLGFEAILAGHRPKLWGQPFYAGWGLSEDRIPLPRRNRKLTRTQLFAAAMILAPVWYNPATDRLCSFEEALDQLEAELRAFREDRRGYVAAGIRMWKRGRFQQFFGGQKRLGFAENLTTATRLAEKQQRDVMIWAGKAPPDAPEGVIRVEDGFLRSRGLGAELVPPLSLVRDDIGIYYDPSRPSRLEHLILSPLPPGGRARAEALLERLQSLGITKYNLAGAIPEIPAPTSDAPRILVPGQVEDDASILLGAGAVRTNLALLQATREANPGAILIWKPHPDVAAGLRPGAVPEVLARQYADVTADGAAMAPLLDAVDEVWTMTSLTGFEALIRGKRVTTLGAPFYAGWGLTRDLGPGPQRRLRRADGSLQPRPDLAHLVHAALIAYPRYWDPVSRRPCPVELTLERLATGKLPSPGRANRLLAKLQGRFASHAWLWR